MADVVIGVGKAMDVELEGLKQALEPRWASFEGTSQKVAKILSSKTFRGSPGTSLNN